MSARQPLSVFIITHNEARNLPRALASVAWADERLVVDSGSTDGTVELARAAGARVEHRPWTGGFGEYKEMALRLCTHRWVLLVDADEEVTAAQRLRITAMLAAHPVDRALAFRRKSYFGTQWIRGLGWYPDYVVRLFPQDKGRFSPDKVHERVVVDVPVEYRPEAFNHYSYRDESDFRARSERYAQLWAQTAAARGKSPAAFPALRGWLTFFRCYVLQYGFIDGANGLLLSRLYAEYTRRKYELLREQTQ